MAKKINPDDTFHANRIRPAINAIWCVVMGVSAIICILPVLFVYIIAFTDENSLMVKGFSFFPNAFSLNAFRYLLAGKDQVFSSFGVSLFVSIVGTIFSLSIMALLAYVLSRSDYRYCRPVTFLVLFTMLFNGGLVPTYIINNSVLHLYDNIWVLILPLSVNAFWIIVLRTFYKSIPIAVIESAKIDGAGEFTTFLRIVVPLSKPGLATIGLFAMIQYWNDWFQGLLYIQTPAKQPLQTFLWSLQASMENLINNADKSASDLMDLMANPPTDSTRMAMTALVITPILFAYPFFQKYFVKGLTVGSVKE